jgi:hypothetical protein
MKYCARCTRFRPFQRVIARLGSPADIAEKAANVAAVATIGSAVGKSRGVTEDLFA